MKTTTTILLGLSFAIVVGIGYALIANEIFIRSMESEYDLADPHVAVEKSCADRRIQHTAVMSNNSIGHYAPCRDRDSIIDYEKDMRIVLNVRPKIPLLSYRMGLRLHSKKGMLVDVKIWRNFEAI